MTGSYDRVLLLLVRVTLWLGQPSFRAGMLEHAAAMKTIFPQIADVGND